MTTRPLPPSKDRMSMYDEKITRRSWISPEKLLRIHQQLKTTNPNFFKNPYVTKEENIDGLSILHQAASTGNCAMVKHCLRAFYLDAMDIQGLSPNVVFNFFIKGRTPLMHAALGNHLSCIRLLHRSGAQLDIQNSEGLTNVHIAVLLNHPQLLDLLLSLGANWRIHDHNGRSPIHWAVGSNSTSCLKLLLHNALPSDINEIDNELMSPSHWAVFHNQPTSLKSLLRYDVDLTSTDVEGKTPLHWCAPHKDIACAKLITLRCPDLANKQDLDGRTVLHLACGEKNILLVAFLLATFPSCNLNCVDAASRTALHWAAVSGHHRLVTLLLNYGALDNVKDGLGATPLHYACSKNHSQCVSAFLASPNFSYLPDNEGRYALSWTVTKGHVQTVRILLQQGLDPHSRDNQGNTALHAAAHTGQTQCVSLLLEQGADPNLVDAQGLTALFRSAEKGYTDTANLLIQSGASVNAVDLELRTPLHWAAIFGHLPVLSLLLLNNCAVDQSDTLGKTEIASAAYHGHSEIVKFLLESGADVNARDYQGNTPLHWAARGDNIETMVLLMEEGADSNPLNNSHPKHTPLDYVTNPSHPTLLRMYHCKMRNELEEFSALWVQKRWRGLKVRRFLNRDILNDSIARKNRAASVIQRCYRRWITLSKLKSLPISEPKWSLSTLIASAFSNVSPSLFTSDSSMGSPSGTNHGSPVDIPPPTCPPPLSFLPQNSDKQATLKYQSSLTLQSYQQQLRLILKQQEALDKSKHELKSLMQQLLNSSDDAQPVLLHENENLFLPPPATAQSPAPLPEKSESILLHFPSIMDSNLETASPIPPVVSMENFSPSVSPDKSKAALENIFAITMATAERGYFELEQKIHKADMLPDVPRNPGDGQPDQSGLKKKSRPRTLVNTFLSD